tara:strand:+ start:436 stop:636 length:201 start_codon:yes stop_codon:yes gene_type:complete
MPKEKREVTLKLSELEKDLLIYICHMTARDKRSSLSKNIDKFNNLDDLRFLKSKISSAYNKGTIIK